MFHVRLVWMMLMNRTLKTSTDVHGPFDINHRTAVNRGTGEGLLALARNGAYTLPGEFFRVGVPPTFLLL
jgi:hypothetical protein